MPSSCSAHGCARRLQKGSDVRMFRFTLLNKETLDAWVRKVGRFPAPGQKSGRSDGLWKPKEHDRICSLHFVNGCPSKDTQDVDYIPSLFAHTPAAKKSPKILAKKINRHNRVRQREQHKSKSAAALTSSIEKVREGMDPYYC